MTQPALAFNLQGRGRHYPWEPCDVSTWKTRKYGTTEVVHPSNVPDDIRPMPSITNILGVLHKNLVGYGGEHAIRDFRDCPDCKAGNFHAHHDDKRDCGCGDADDPDFHHILKAHKWAANKHRDQRADEGTRAHSIAERLTIDAPIVGDLTDADEAFADAFMGFWTDHDPTPVYTETTVAHPGLGYAGTADLYAEVDGPLTVIDYKTRDGAPDDKKSDKYGLLYESNRMQLAALASAPFRCWVAGHERMPTVERAMGVVLFSNGEYRIETLDAGELGRWYGGFVGALQTWRSMKGAAA